MTRLDVFVLFLAFQASSQLEKQQLFSTKNCIEGVEESSRSEIGSRPLDLMRVLTSTLAPVIEVEWNSTGHAVNFSGFFPYIVHLVAERMGINYCWVPLGRDMSFDGNKGLVIQLAEGKGDLLAGTLVRSHERFKLIDLTVPTLEGPFSVMIPFPEKTINRNALGKPFQREVWIILLVTVIFVILVLYLFNLAHKRFNETDYARAGLNDSFTYVLTILLTQGNYYANQKTANRFIAGAWCLGAFIIVSAYSGTLLSFIMSPVSKPVISSFYDLANIPELKVAVDKGRAADLRLTAASEFNSGSFGKVITVIEKTIYRCNTSARCIELTLTGEYVYVHGRPAVNQMIIDDLAKTGKCRFTEAKEPFLNGHLCWGLPKQAPLNQGISNAYYRAKNINRYLQYIRSLDQNPGARCFWLDAVLAVTVFEGCVKVHQTGGVISQQQPTIPLARIRPLYSSDYRPNIRDLFVSHRKNRL